MGYGEMKKSLLITLLTLPILFWLRWHSASFFVVKHCYVSQTGLLSDDCFKSITTHVREELDNNQKAHVIIADIKKIFPILEKISISYRPTGTYVKVVPYKPLCCINNNLILTHNHELCSQDTFAQEVIDSIAHIAVAPDCSSKMASLVPLLLHELPADFYETHNLELCNEHYVRLTDKQEKYFNILLSANQKQIPSLLTYCDLVKKNIIERKGFEKGIYWTADVRFTDHIVVYRI